MLYKIIIGTVALIGSASGYAGTIGLFVIAPDSISSEAEAGRVLYISDVRFSEITTLAKKGDIVEISRESFEVLVVVPGKILTVIDMSSRSEVRVLVNASASKK
jgi:hypothetical protein